MNIFTLELEHDKLTNIIPFVQFCINSQGKDIELEVNNEGHCLRHCKVYDILDMFEFTSVLIKTHNSIEQHDKYQIDNTMWNIWLAVSHREVDLTFNYEWNKEKIFGCFFGRPTAPRLGIAGHLAKYYDKQSLVITKFAFSDIDARPNFDVQRLFNWNQNGLGLITNLVYNNKYYHNDGYIKGSGNIGNHQLEYLYKNIFIDIVSEPTCEGNAFYPTEKIARVILCRKPFIAMCSKNYLIYLRQLGFRTFYDFWSEDYDGFDGNIKYQTILDLIDNIANKSLNELELMYTNMQDILDHNYNLLISQQYKKTVVRVDE
jgi:hypothetical protein